MYKSYKNEMTYKQIPESYYQMVRQLIKRSMKIREKNNKKIDIKMDPFPILRGKGSLPFASL